MSKKLGELMRTPEPSPPVPLCSPVLQGSNAKGLTMMRRPPRFPAQMVTPGNNPPGNGEQFYNQTMVKKKERPRAAGCRSSNNSRNCRRSENKSVERRRPTLPSDHELQIDRETIPETSNFAGQVEVRLQEIESVMGYENENLRQQKDYLLGVIAKLQDKQRQYKDKISNYKTYICQLEGQNAILKQKYEQARTFITKSIDRVEQVVSCDKVDGSSNKNTTEESNQGSSITISNQIEELNDQFEALIYEYQKTRDPMIRKRCFQIAKTLKKLKKEQSVSHFPMTIVAKKN